LHSTGLLLLLLLLLCCIILHLRLLATAAGLRHEAPWLPDAHLTHTAVAVFGKHQHLSVCSRLQEHISLLLLLTNLHTA
jgi:hypothetical protein